MLADEKILVTGPAGQIAFPLAARLARDNEVWGVARFSEEGSRDRCEDAGITTRRVDLGQGHFDELPEDFTYVLHLAAYLGGESDYGAALRVNAEGTGVLMHRFRRARAVMVMSTGSVYKPHDDPFHRIREDDPLGDASLPAVPTYSISKISQEAVARTMCRTLEVPTVIARMNVAYGDNGGLPVHHLDNIVADRPITFRWDPAPYVPIHENDVYLQLEALLDAASVPATIVNWGGDDVVTAQQWCAHFEELTGRTAQSVVTPIPGTRRGTALDNTKRLSITGPASVQWRDGMSRLFANRYRNGLDAGPLGPRAAHAMQAAESKAQNVHDTTK
ncbi:MAG: NAD(P)-dependent oxidoreductase [Acidimicrobiales bacterium]|nr:NAD(P)-dependent oxidoreductase [Acidimicrobiales bacterium]